MIVTRSPAFPQSNGLAEPTVKITKKILNSPKPLIALMNYRATPTAVGYSPAQLLYNRQIRTKVPSINLNNCLIKRADLENRDKRRRDRMKRNFDQAKGVHPLTELSPGRKVLVEDANKKGVVIKKRSEPRSYDVRLENGTVLRRNRKTLRRLPSCSLDWPNHKGSATSTPPASPKTPPSGPKMPRTKTTLLPCPNTPMLPKTPSPQLDPKTGRPIRTTRKMVDYRDYDSP